MWAHASMFCSSSQLVYPSDLYILSCYMSNSEKQVTKETKPRFWQAICEYANIPPECSVAVMNSGRPSRRSPFANLPFSTEKMYLAIHLALISQFHFFPSSYLTESVLQLRSFQQHFHSKCKTGKQERGLLQSQVLAFDLFLYSRQKPEKGKKFGKKFLI